MNELLSEAGGELSRVSGKTHYTLPDGETASITLPQKPIPPGMSRVFGPAGLINQAYLPASVQYGAIELRDFRDLQMPGY